MLPSQSISHAIRILIYLQIVTNIFCQLPSISQYHILPINPILADVYVGIACQQTFTMNPSTLNISQVRFLNTSILPDGLHFQNSSIVGTPTVAGNFSISIQAQIHSLMIQIDANFSLNVKAVLLLNSSIPNIKLNTPFSLTLAARGGIGILLWSFQNLPAWASANGSTISGRPTTFGNFPLNVTIKDQKNNTLVQNYSLIVQSQNVSLLKITPSQIIVTANVLYSVLLTPSGGAPPYIVQYPNKPTWLTTDKNLVQISVSDLGEFTFPVLIIDSRGNFQTINVKVKSVNEQAGLIDYINRATSNIVDPKTGIKMTIFNNNWMNNGSSLGISLSQSSNTATSSPRTVPNPSNNGAHDALLATSYIRNKTTINRTAGHCKLQAGTVSSIGVIKQVKYPESQIVLTDDRILQFQNCTKQVFKNSAESFRVGDSVTFSGNLKANVWFVHSISNLS